MIFVLTFPFGRASKDYFFAMYTTIKFSHVVQTRLFIIIIRFVTFDFFHISRRLDKISEEPIIDCAKLLNITANGFLVNVKAIKTSNNLIIFLGGKYFSLLY